MFVHGVNARKDPKYRTLTDARDAMFRAHLLTSVSANWPRTSILNPYWGNFGGKFAWNFASSPRSDIEVLGATEQLAADLAGEFTITPSPNTAVLQLARADGLPSALDVLWLFVDGEMASSSALEKATLGRDLYEWASGNPRPIWLAEIETDGQLIQRLIAEAGEAAAPRLVGEERLGGRPQSFYMLREGVDRLAFAVSAMASGGIVNPLRRASRRAIENFMGDILAYLDSRKVDGGPGEIISSILASLDQGANEASSTGAPLIIVAHSMGGIIVYDILSYFRPDLEVDLLVTVGSQVGVFAELRRLLISPSDIPGGGGSKLPALPGVKRWLNVFDHKDLLGFATADIFNGVRDYAYDTGRGLLASHTMYFQRLSFHHFLSERAAQRD